PPILTPILKFIKSELVLFIAWTAAALTLFFVPIDQAYLGYVDFSVLSILFCLMAVVAGFLKTGVFDVLTHRLMQLSSNLKSIALLLVCACFFSAMLVTNDVALLTFVPLTLGIMGAVGPKPLVFVLVMETIAANIGSMLTPIGNPQNLYLYSFYDMNIGDFLRIVAPVCLAGFLIIAAFVLLTPAGSLPLSANKPAAIRNRPHLLVYGLLFLLAILTVLHLVDYRITLAITIAALLFCDPKLLAAVDYSLLLTFVAFFVFVGNLGRIPWVKAELSSFLAGREFIAGVLVSQIISNVPAAMMLSGFTSQASPLLLGVNVGGLGTLVASLASLISFKLYAKSKNAKAGLFFLVFTACNLAVLALLVAVVFAAGLCG
ncbi:MAG: SLC13 family permease, partial [Clostridia bacterium]